MKKVNTKDLIGAYRSHKIRNAGATEWGLVFLASDEARLIDAVGRLRKIVFTDDTIICTDDDAIKLEYGWVPRKYWLDVLIAIEWYNSTYPDNKVTRLITRNGSYRVEE